MSPELIAIIIVGLTNAASLAFLWALHNDVAGLRERLARLEERFVTLEQRFVRLEERMARWEGLFERLTANVRESSLFSRSMGVSPGPSVHTVPPGSQPSRQSVRAPVHRVQIASVPRGLPRPGPSRPR